MYKTIIFIAITCLFSLNVSAFENVNSNNDIKKILFIGDSMTGWLSDRLGGYADNNDLNISTIVWDGSTIEKWSKATSLNKIISNQSPDLVIISLGLNELFENNPNRLSPYLHLFLKKLNDIPYIWIGPPSWPGHNAGTKFNDWIEQQVQKGHFFNSFELQLPRQSKTNPHPTREGCNKWMDLIVRWIQSDASAIPNFINNPPSKSISRSPVFLYKKLKESL